MKDKIILYIDNRITSAHRWLIDCAHDGVVSWSSIFDRLIHHNKLLNQTKAEEYYRTVSDIKKDIETIVETGKLKEWGVL